MTTVDQTNFKKIPLPEGKYISEIEPFKSNGIPSDSIIHKVVTGCGMTHCELETKRNSIIILPNVPVIKGKVESWNKKYGASKRIIGIYKGKEIPLIERYLESGVRYKKILTTPEAFSRKVVLSFTEAMNMRENYFLLYDECERLTSDVSYRPKITAPLDVFFDFKCKALVSATVLPFSDKRFETFDHYILVPQFEYKKSLKLIATNNVLESARHYLCNLDAPQVSIFVNSTNTIAKIINGLGIRDDSRIHCSDDSVNKLRIKWGLHNASSALDVSAFKKYNFFTGRFFSAVDIHVTYKPAIVIITELVHAEQSIIDPHTEAIQISGRYRKGIGSLAHISNFNPGISAMTPEETKGYIDAHLQVYNLLKRMYNNEADPVRKNAFELAFKSLPAHDFYKQGSYNAFMVDNVYHEERVKGYYRSPDELARQYNEASGHFSVILQPEEYALGDADDIGKYHNLSKAQQNRIAASDLHKLTPRLDNMILFEPEGRRAWIRANYPLVGEAYDLFGIEGLEKTDYSDAAIRRAIKTERERIMLLELQSKAELKFKGRDVVLDATIKDDLQAIYDEAGYTEPAKPADIKKFFPKAKRTTVVGEHAHRLSGNLKRKRKNND